MTSPSLTLVEPLHSIDRTNGTQTRITEARGAEDGHLEACTEAPTEEVGLPLFWTSGLDRLKTACERAAKADRERRALVTLACQQIARHVGEAGLYNLPLPRDYEVRAIDRRWVLVKCVAENARTTEPCTREPREVRYVASGEESLWTRFNLQTTHLTEAQVGELIEDLEAGLIEEMAHWVESRTVAPPVTPSNTPRPATIDEDSAVEARSTTDPCRLRLVDLGRSRRRPARPAPIRRTA